MSTLEISPAASEAGHKHYRVVNDFSIQVATVNGSGSQTANNVLMRSIFQMGIPVSGKNLFPSNIAGLPTWFTIRANKNGWIGRKKEIDFLVAMNPETAREDVLKLDAGAAALYDEPLKLNELRSEGLIERVQGVGTFAAHLFRVASTLRIRDLHEEITARGHRHHAEVHLARLNLRRHLAAELRSDFESTWQALAPNEAYAPDGAQVGRRALRNACLAYLADGDAAAVLPRLLAQLHDGGNMTDVIAALGILANQDLPERQTALDAFRFPKPAPSSGWSPA